MSIVTELENNNSFESPLNSNSIQFSDNPNLSTIAFVDSRISDPMTVMTALQSDVKVLLDPTRDGIVQITEVLKKYQGLSGIDIISHGNVAQVQLGNITLNANNLEQYADQLQQWEASLSPDADILFHGCNIAAGDLGQAFINSLGNLTGADIAASTDTTGNATKGGNWTLEYATGKIETAMPFTDSLINSYQGILPYLSDLTPTSATNGWGPIERDRSNGEQAAGDGSVLTLNGVTYTKGLGVHGASDITYTLGGTYSRFISDIGIDDYSGSRGSVVFQVWADGIQLYDSGVMTGSSPTQTVDVDLIGRQSLRLVVTDGGDGNGNDHANWADARLEVPTGPDTTPPTSTLSATNFTTSVNSTTPYTFTVTYTDNVAVDFESIDSNDLLVTGPNSFSQLATLVGVTPASNNRQLTATYQIAAPSGGWTGNDVGTYTIVLQAEQVTDTNTNAIAASTLGSFLVTAGTSTYLSDLTPTSATNGWGPFERDRSNGERAAGDGGVLTLNGVTYTKGLGVHAGSSLTYALNGTYTRFQSDIGVDDYSTGSRGSVVFQVFADGVLLFDSGVMNGASATRTVDVDVTGRQSLRLVVTDGGNGNAGDHADWANARLVGTPAGPDTTAPTPTLTAAGITAPTTSPYTFTVTYTDQTAVNFSTLGTGDVRVTGPGGFSQLATFVSATPATNSTSITATYRLTAPDGTWNWNDRGTYEVVLLGNEVRDTLNNTTAANTSLGNFSVDITSIITVGLNSTQVTEGGIARIPIRRTGDATGTATINYFTGGNTTGVAGVNYTAIPVSTLTFLPNEVEKFIEVQTLNDNAAGTNVTVSLLLESPTGADLGPSRTSSITIRDVSAPTDPTFTYLSTLNPTTATNGWGPYERDRANGEQAAGDGGTITMNGVTYNRGLGVHAASELTYNLSGNYNSFFAYVGVNDNVGSRGSVRFQVFADGTLLFDSGVMTGSSDTQLANVNVTGRQTLRLVVTDSGDGNSSDHANWADAQLVVGQYTPPPPPPTPTGNFVREGLISGVSRPTTIEWSPDGRLMYIAQKDGTVRVYVNPADANVQFSSVQRYATGSNAHGIDAADVNNDGLVDLIVANTGVITTPSSATVSVLLGRGDGTFNPAVNYQVGLEPKSVVAIDVNGDGFADLITANQGTNDVSVLFNNGNGTFASAVSYAGPARAHEVMASDLDGDGDRDLFIVGWGASIVRVLRNNGSGVFGSATDYAVGNAPHSLQLRDFTGDGRADIAVANLGSSSVSILTNTGTGVFNAAVSYSVGSQPHSIRAADLDGDGDIDLVTANQASNSVTILRNNGAGAFTLAGSYATGSVPKGITLADMNGDGFVDILTANTAGNYPNANNPGGDTISVLLGNASGTFSAPRTHYTGRTPFSLVTADFNRDGRLDVATANWHTGDVGVLINRTNVVTPPSGLTPGLLPTPFINISDRVNNVSDRGLLGMTLHPDFGRGLGRDYVYLLYTFDPPEAASGSGLAARDRIGNRPAQLMRVTADPSTNFTTAIAGSEVILLGSNSLWQYTSNPNIDSTDNFSIPPSGVANGTNIQPPSNLIEDPDPANLGRDYSATDTDFENNNNIRDYIAGDSTSHSIAQVLFGPDGYLYVTIGDGTSYNGVDWRSTRVQDVDNLSGKILRIDPITGQGVSDNPFWNGNADSNRSKVFALGFRNPFRFTFDPVTGSPYVGDVGWTTWEEINLVVPGGNYGWPYFEGPAPNTGYSALPQAQGFTGGLAPLLSRNHSASLSGDGRPTTALIMGDIYSGSTFPSRYNQSIFYSDVGLGYIYVSFLSPDGTVSSTELFDENLQYIVDMETGPDGSLYYVSLFGNEIGRWRPA